MPNKPRLPLLLLRSLFLLALIVAMGWLFSPLTQVGAQTASPVQQPTSPAVPSEQPTIPPAPVDPTDIPAPQPTSAPPTNAPPTTAPTSALPTNAPPTTAPTTVPATNAPPNGGGGGGGGDQPNATEAPGTHVTATPTRPSGTRVVRTPSRTPARTPTATITPTPTPTVLPAYVKVLVYMDSNNDQMLGNAEGVDGLLIVLQAVTATGETWEARQMTHLGVTEFNLPSEVEKGAAVQLQAPYLHWKKELQAPERGERTEAELRLKLPEYPVYLP